MIVALIKYLKYEALETLGHMTVEVLLLLFIYTVFMYMQGVCEGRPPAGEL